MGRGRQAKLLPLAKQRTSQPDPWLSIEIETTEASRTDGFEDTTVKQGGKSCEGSTPEQGGRQLDSEFLWLGSPPADSKKLRRGNKTLSEQLAGIWDTLGTSAGPKMFENSRAIGPSRMHQKLLQIQF